MRPNRDDSRTKAIRRETRVWLGAGALALGLWVAGGVAFLGNVISDGEDFSVARITVAEPPMPPALPTMPLPGVAGETPMPKLAADVRTWKLEDRSEDGKQVRVMIVRSFGS